MPPLAEASAASLSAAAAPLLVGSVVYVASQWAVLVLLARLGTQEIVGEFTLGLAVSAPVFLFASLGLRPLQATDARRGFPAEVYARVRAVSSLVALGAIVLSLAVTGATGAGTWTILVVAMAKASEAQSEVIYGALQRREQMSAIAVSLVLKAALGVAAVAFAMSVFGTSVSAAAALLIVSVVVLWSYDLPRMRRIVGDSPSRIDSSSICSLLRLGLPVAFALCLGSLAPNLPRYFLAAKVGAEALGAFAAVAYLLVIGGILLNTIGQAVSPRLARSYVNGDRRTFRVDAIRLIGIAVFLGFATVAVSLIFGSTVLALLYGEAYGRYQPLLVIVAIAGALSWCSSAMGYIATATRRIRLQPYAQAVVAISTATAAWWMVPQMGLTGAAGSLVVGSSSGLLSWSVILTTRADGQR